MAPSTLTRRATVTLRRLLVPALLLGLGIVPATAGLGRLGALVAGQASAEHVRFFVRPLPITIHILAVIPYSLLGALQFAPALRRRGWHRAVGTALVPLGLIAALSGLWMTHYYPWPTGDGEALYLMRLIVGVAMTVSIVRGAASLGRREYASHGAWMLRGYALGMGAGTQVLTHLPWFIFVGGSPGEGSRAGMMGLAWVINAVLAEYIIRTRAATQVSAESARTRPVLLATTSGARA